MLGRDASSPRSNHFDRNLLSSQQHANPAQWERKHEPRDVPITDSLLPRRAPAREQFPTNPKPVMYGALKPCPDGHLLILELNLG